MSAEAAVDELEAEFASALLSPERRPPAGLKVPPGADAAHRFGVYRNNVVAGLVAALGERFPVTRRIVGEPFFAATGRAYVAEHPPRSPLLFRYGDDFPQFLADIAAVATVPYVPDVARLEFLRGEAYHAADRAPVAPATLTALSASDLGRVGIELHPSVRILRSLYPVVAIWLAHQDEGAAPVIQVWRPEDAFVTRRGFSVDVHRLPAGGHAFVSSAAHGGSIEDAVAAAGADDADFDPQATFALLIAAQAITGIRKIG